MSAENVVFLFVLAVAAGFFALNVQRLVQYLRLGKPEHRIDRPWQRVWNVLRVGIAQTKILREPVAGVMHATIFWGFIVLTAGTIELLIAGVFPGFSYERFLPSLLYGGYELSQDAFAVFVLGAVAFAYFRRLVLHPRRLEGDNVEHLDAYIILGLIGALLVGVAAGVFDRRRRALLGLTGRRGLPRRTVALDALLLALRVGAGGMRRAHEERRGRDRDCEDGLPHDITGRC